MANIDIEGEKDKQMNRSYTQRSCCRSRNYKVLVLKNEERKKKGRIIGIGTMAELSFTKTRRVLDSQHDVDRNYYAAESPQGWISLKVKRNAEGCFPNCMVVTYTANVWQPTLLMKNMTILCCLYVQSCCSFFTSFLRINVIIKIIHSFYYYLIIFKNSFNYEIFQSFTFVQQINGHDNK